MRWAAGCCIGSGAWAGLLETDLYCETASLSFCGLDLWSLVQDVSFELHSLTRLRHEVMEILPILGCDCDGAPRFSSAAKPQLDSTASLQLFELQV